MVNMTIASRNLPKIGVGVAKEEYEFYTDTRTSKKAIPVSTYLKNYFDSDSIPKHATPTSDTESITLD